MSVIPSGPNASMPEGNSKNDATMLKKAIRKSPYTSGVKTELKKLLSEGAEVKPEESYLEGTKLYQCHSSFPSLPISVRISIENEKNSGGRYFEFIISPAIALRIIHKLKGKIDYSLTTKDIETEVRTMLENNVETEISDFQTYTLSAMKDIKSIKSQNAPVIQAEYLYQESKLPNSELLTVKVKTNGLYIDGTLTKIEIMVNAVIDQTKMREDDKFTYPLNCIAKCCFEECQKLANIAEYQEEASVLEINRRGSTSKKNKSCNQDTRNNYYNNNSQCNNVDTLRPF